MKFFGDTLTLKKSAILALFVITAGCQDSNTPTPKSPAIPTQQPAGSFNSSESSELTANPKLIKTALFLTQNHLHETALKELTKIGAKIRTSDSKSGLIIASARGADLIRFAKLNAAEGINSAVSDMSLSQSYKFDHQLENINPFTGLKHEPNNIKLVTTPYSSQLPVQDLGVKEFRSLIQSDYGFTPNGDSVIIAITDTGLDISHTDVFQNRVIQSRDFTSEGKFNLKLAEYDDVKKSVKADLSDVVQGLDSAVMEVSITENMKSIDGKYYLGAISEQNYNSGEGLSDLNQDGESNSTLPLIVYMTKEGPVAAIDKDIDGSFAGDTIVRNFADSLDRIYLDPSKRVAVNFNFLLDDNKQLIIGENGLLTVEMAGFDNGRHGTHVAGMAAGRFEAPQFKGGLTSAAPYAKLMGIKVLGAQGGSDADILDGVLFAVQNGADIVNMSLGGLRRPTLGNDASAKAIDRIARSYDAVFVISAGNSGPGLNQVGSPGSAHRAVTVGASVSHETYSSAFGINVPFTGQFMWFFSSNGPLDDGRVKPTLVAPGSALSSVSKAKSNYPEIPSFYDVMQGTSMASPAATGAIALLRDALNKINQQDKATIASDNLSIEKSLIDGAINLNELNKFEGTMKSAFTYSAIEQGAGLLNLSKTFLSLKNRLNQKSTEYVVTTKSLRQGLELEKAFGVYASRPLPDSISLSVSAIIDQNQYPDIGRYYQSLKLSASAPWIVLREPDIGIIGDNTTDVRVNFDRAALRSLPPGLHHGRIFARDAETGQLEFVFDITYTKGEELNANNSNTYTDTKLNLLPGEMKRHYFLINEDISSLSVDLQTLFMDEQSKKNAPGLLLHVYDPTGRIVFESEKYLIGEHSKDAVSLQRPTPGVWEVVIFKSPASKSTAPAQLRVSTSQLKLEKSQFVIQAGTKPVSQKVGFVNYGQPLNLKTDGSINSLVFTDEAIVLKNKESIEVAVEIPEGVVSGRVGTDGFKNDLDVDIDIDLIDEDGKSIASADFAAGVLFFDFKATQGKKARLVIKAKDLGKPSLKLNIDWAFLLSAPAKINSRLSQKEVSWGDSAQMAFSLDPSTISQTALNSFKQQGKSVVARGEVNFINSADSGETLVHKVPVLVVFP
jgi:subtilisin family serine protease